LLHPVFSQAFMGYAGAEVDEFLREIAEAISKLSADKANLAQRVAGLEARLADCEAEKQEALNALDRKEAWPREKIDAAKRRIKQEATAIIREAEAKAENIIRQGNLRLVRIMDEIAAAEEFNRELKEQISGVQRNILTWLNRNKPARKGRDAPDPAHAALLRADRRADPDPAHAALLRADAPRSSGRAAAHAEPAEAPGKNV
jgi:cell division initiation protein